MGANIFPVVPGNLTYCYRSICSVIDVDILQDQTKSLPRENWGSGKNTACGKIVFPHCWSHKSINSEHTDMEHILISFSATHTSQSDVPHKWTSSNLLRSCRKNTSALASFLQYLIYPVIAICTGMGVLQLWPASSQFGILLNLPINF